MGRMTRQHTAALARGRREARAVRAYLEALREERSGPDPVRVRREERARELRTRIDRAERAAERVELLREWLEIERELADLESGPDLETLEAEFIEVARSFSERKAISYPAWREVGVPARVLREAGITRTRRPRP